MYFVLSQFDKHVLYIQERLWHWERPYKPTEKTAYGISRDSPRPWQRGYQAVPHDVEGQVSFGYLKIFILLL